MVKDLRSFLKQIESSFYRIKKEVDPLNNLAALANEADRTIMFESLKGYPGWKAVAQMPGNWEEIGVTFGVAPDMVIKEFSERIRKGPTPCKIVKTGPVKDVILTGDDVDLTKIPAVVNMEGVSQYITMGVSVVKDPDTGLRNASIHRMQVKGKNKTGLLINTGRHLGEIYRKYEERNEPMPIATFIGHHPLYLYAGAWTGPFGVDELEVAGTLLGEQVELVKGETVDIEVPAYSEIVLEGEVPPRLRELEGPFGPEYQGYSLKMPQMSHVVNIKAMTMRRDPIYLTYYGSTAGMRYVTLGMMETIYRRVKEVEAGTVEVKDVYVYPQYSLVVIQIVQKYWGQARNVLMAALSTQYLYHKIAIVVDEDVNIHDANDVLWAISNRVNPSEDVFIIPKLRMDPMDSSLREIGSQGESIWYALGSKMGIDATKPPLTEPKLRSDCERGRPKGFGIVHLRDFLA